MSVAHAQESLHHEIGGVDRARIARHELRVEPVICVVTSRVADINHYLRRSSDVFLPGHFTLGVGERFELQVIAAQEKVFVHLEARVRRVFLGKGLGQAAGLGVEISNALRSLGAMAAAGFVGFPRARRFRLQQPCTIGSGQQTIGGTLISVSRTGAALESGLRCRVGEPLRISVNEWFDACTVEAMVVRCTATGATCRISESEQRWHSFAHRVAGRAVRLAGQAP